MEVLAWSGRLACRLQAALRLSNEAMAARLGVSTRTVAGWHDRPDLTPRPEMQAALDTLLEGAGAGAKRRFELLNQPAPDAPAGAQALRVAIAIVTRVDEVLLVCRRGDDALSWQFPAGIVKPGQRSDSVAVAETLAETGVRCTATQQLGSRIHPVTGALCDYWLCHHLSGDPTLRDPVENQDVTWVPTSDLTRYIPADRIYPPILAALEGPA